MTGPVYWYFVAKLITIRDSASLYSKKIGTLFDRMVVKVVSIGNEAEIDGIKSNWVQILLPIETINTGLANG